jgi:tetratricopeptide (TPR) repeat protein
VLAILWYAKARLADSWKSSVVFFAACCLSFICSLMSKENAVMLPVSLLLVEMAFFQNIHMFQWVKRRLWLSVGSGLAIIGVTWFVVHAGWLDSFFSGYSTRPFTMGERLLSQPRVVLYYVSQIFYPLPSRLSITHDVIVSTSLFNPWTTLPAILIVLVLVGAGVRLMRRWPLLCFAILFFLINHVVESSILALELIFEHRNYLPSLFLFLPVAAALKGLLDRYQAKSRFMQPILITFITAVIIGLGCFTYTRNQAWRTETTLWQDAMLKAPKDARPMVNLGIQLAWDTKPTSLQLEVAMAMFKKAMSLNMARTFLKTDVINNIGNIYFNKGDFQKAADTYRKGLALDPGYLKMRYDLINSLIMLGQWNAGNKEADILIDNQKGYLEAGDFNLKGFILLWQQHPRAALVFFEKALSMAPDDKAILLNTGVTLGLLGRSEAARAYLDRVVHMTEGDMRPYFALIENSIRAGNIGEAESYAHRMLLAFPAQTIIDGIGLYDGNYRSAPMSAEIIVPVVSKAILAAAYDLEATAFSTPDR